MTAVLRPFDSNDYRKRVLAAVEKRGGPEASDSFELYDIPVELADDLDDATVRARVDEVWGFWQRQRDHPKYRVLVGLLVEGHARRSAELVDGGWRRNLAARIRSDRDRRDTARYELLDAAISRLVKRHKGIPRDKVEGLIEIGTADGLTRAEAQARLNRHRFVAATAAEPEVAPATPAGPAVSDQRRLQVRALLDEFGRLTEQPAPATLLTLLGLDPDASDEQIRARAASWRARTRELPPERIRAVLDELMVHVDELLEKGPAGVAAYLDGVCDDVADTLRPRVRAAVLVEDKLVSEDHQHLLGEAEALGLDRARAYRVLAALATELGAPIEGPTSAPPPPPTPGRPWEAPLRAARAALRAGRLREAEQHAAEARRVGGVEGATPVRAVADEIATALTEAALRWRAARSAYEAKRFAEAAEHLEHLQRTAADVPGPAGSDLTRWLADSRSRVELADQQVAAARDLPEEQRLPALLAVLEICREHPGALEELARIAVEAASAVRAERGADGTITVSWTASPTPAVEYKVSREEPDGTLRVIGRTRATSIEAGQAGGPIDSIPVYVVVASQAGRKSAEARSAVVPALPRTVYPPTDPPPTRPPQSPVAPPPQPSPSAGKIDYTRRTPRGRR